MAGKPNNKMFKTMVSKHGDEERARAWFAAIGALGGSKRGVKKGFAANPALASRAGALGGSRSKRGPARKAETA